MGNAFIRAQKICAEEAVYLTIGLKLRDSSRQFQFIPSAAPDERTFLVKEDGLLQTEDPNSTNIAVASIIDRYANRPCIPEFEELSLAEFAAWYERSRKDSVAEKDVGDDQVGRETTVDEPSVPQLRLLLQVGYRLRKHPKIIRFVNYKEAKEPEKYYREQVLLFHPWRVKIEGNNLTPEDNAVKENEALLQGCESFKERYEEIVHSIARVRDNFVKDISIDYDDFQRQVQEEKVTSLWGESLACLAPCVEHENDQGVSCCQDDPPSGEVEQYDLAEDLGGRQEGAKSRIEYAEDIIEDSAFRKMVRCLNPE
jgi:hypothetical protein